MPRSADVDWKKVERLVRTTDLSFYAIAERTGAARSTIRHRAAKGEWRPGLKPLPPPRPPIERTPRTPADARRALIQRFYRAIDTKLKQMEQRMKKEMQNDDATQSAADHERDTRAIGGLINQLAKISEYEADLDRSAGQGDDFADLAAEAERYRRELAERLARLIRPVE
jgi:hypothetical protein